MKAEISVWSSPPSSSYYHVHYHLMMVSGVNTTPNAWYRALECFVLRVRVVCSRVSVIILRVGVIYYFHRLNTTIPL